MNPPLFIHVHVPKTAGTSLNQALVRWFREAHVNWYSTVPGQVWTSKEVESFVAANPGMRSLASHSIRCFPPLIAGRKAIYYCFLRNPVDWLISNFTYAKKNFRLLSEEHRQQLPSDAELMSIKDLVEFAISREASAPLRNNWLNRFFSEQLYQQNKHLLPETKSDADDNARYQSVCVLMSAMVLDSFALVGFTNRFQNGVEALRRLVCRSGIAAEPVDLPPMNISSELRSDLSWLCEADQTGRKVLAALENDIRLYHHAEERFNTADVN